jgi:hypothetical protein
LKFGIEIITASAKWPRDARNYPPYPEDVSHRSAVTVLYDPIFGRALRSPGNSEKGSDRLETTGELISE